MVVGALVVGAHHGDDGHLDRDLVAAVLEQPFEVVFREVELLEQRNDTVADGPPGQNIGRSRYGQHHFDLIGQVVNIHD